MIGCFYKHFKGGIYLVTSMGRYEIDQSLTVGYVDVLDPAADSTHYRAFTEWNRPTDSEIRFSRLGETVLTAFEIASVQKLGIESIFSIDRLQEDRDLFLDLQVKFREHNSNNH